MSLSMTTTGWLGSDAYRSVTRKTRFAIPSLTKTESAHTNYFKPGVKLVPRYPAWVRLKPMKWTLWPKRWLPQFA